MLHSLTVKKKHYSKNYIFTPLNFSHGQLQHSISLIISSCCFVVFYVQFFMPGAFD